MCSSDLDDHDDALDEQGAVLDGLALIQLKDLCHGALLHMELPAIDEVEAHQHGRQNEDHRQTGVGHKVQRASQR